MARFSPLCQKNFHDISVTELAARADYDRKTFYRHFSCKEDILTLHCKTILAEMAAMMKDQGPLTFRTGLLSFFQFWENHRDFLSLLARNDLLYFLERNQEQLIYQFVGSHVHDNLPDTLEGVSPFSKYSFYFTIGGLWNILFQWIQSPTPDSPEKITEYVLQYLQAAQNYI